MILGRNTIDGSLTVFYNYLKSYLFRQVDQIQNVDFSTLKIMFTHQINSNRTLSCINHIEELIEVLEKREEVTLLKIDLLETIFAYYGIDRVLIAEYNQLLFSVKNDRHLTCHQKINPIKTDNFNAEKCKTPNENYTKEANIDKVYNISNKSIKKNNETRECRSKQNVETFNNVKKLQTKNGRKDQLLYNEREVLPGSSRSKQNLKTFNNVRKLQTKDGRQDLLFCKEREMLPGSSNETVYLNKYMLPERAISIACQVGSKWKELARYLNLPEIRIDELEGNMSIGTKDKIKLVLDSYQNRCIDDLKESEILNGLLNAFKKIKRNDLHCQLTEYIQRLVFNSK
uniref:Death domain-containing protein n=1 Tax=Clastoptera arizonana TaxID=38151 RepID=A0A1B6D5N0_9HEMI